MFEDERDDKIYNLIITSGIDKNNEYGQFTEKLYSKVDFYGKNQYPVHMHMQEKHFTKK